MCNPRRVMIHLNRCIRESWSQAIEQCARATDQVNQLGSMTAEVKLAEEMGEPAVKMLERVLSGEFETVEAWDKTENGGFRKELENVQLEYDPKNRTLRIEAGLSEGVTAYAAAVEKAEGFTEGEVDVKGEGIYYDDEWGGRTKKVAEKEAVKDAESKLDQAVQMLHQKQHNDKIKDAKAKAFKKANEKASSKLEQKMELVKKALREKLEAILEKEQKQVHRVMNAIIGETYRRTLREMVYTNGGRVVEDKQTGSVINMELELY